MLGGAPLLGDDDALGLLDDGAVSMARRMSSANVAVVWYRRALTMATAAYPAKVRASSTAC
jgi:hypothetical protein